MGGLLIGTEPIQMPQNAVNGNYGVRTEQPCMECFLPTLERFARMLAIMGDDKEVTVR
jgi:hypothetical protein